MLLAANTFIIYFAIGVPLAVLSFYLNRGHLESREAIRAVSSLLLWPLLLARSAYLNFIISTADKGGERTDSPSDRFREYLKNEIAEDLPRSFKRELLFEYERVISLSTALKETENVSSAAGLPLMDAFKHQSPTIAAKCHQRRTKALLKRHQHQASNNLVGMIEKARSLDIIIPHEFEKKLFDFTQSAESPHQTSITLNDYSSECANLTA